jgi:hypothetical protein
MQAAASSEKEIPPGLPKRLGEYELGKLLGEGGMGSVYLARHHALHYEVAIKLLNAGSVRPSNLVRFEEEAKKLAVIQDLHVVQFKHYERATQSRPSYIVMEALKGETLRTHLATLSRLKRWMPIADAVAIGCAMARAIAVAHDIGIVHRDVKPSNVFLCPVNGEDGPLVKMLDFGIAKLLDNSSPDLTQDGLPVGTAGWMAPEQIKSRGSNKAADQYSLGAVLYNALTGRPPFPVNQQLQGDARDGDIWRRMAAGDFPAPRALRPEIPPEVEAIVMRAMRIDPAERFENMRSLGAALLPFASPDSVWRTTRFFGTPLPGRAPAPTRPAPPVERTVDPVTAATASVAVGEHVPVAVKSARPTSGRTIRRVIGGVAGVGVAALAALALVAFRADSGAREAVEDGAGGIEIAPSVPALVTSAASAALPDYPTPSSAPKRGALGGPAVLGSSSGLRLDGGPSERRAPSRKRTKVSGDAAQDWSLVGAAKRKPEAGAAAPALRKSVKMLDGNVPDL